MTGPADDDDPVDSIHHIAVELGELDGMTERVFRADDWCRERDELRSRLEVVQRDLATILEVL